MLQASNARQARSTAFDHDIDENKENEAPEVAKAGKIQAQATKVKRDFFGRVIKNTRPASAGKGAQKGDSKTDDEAGRVWVSFHEGFSNAVRKPITLKELLETF